MYPERFSDLPAYAFPRLRSLLADLEPGGAPLRLTIGEPTHPFPDFVASRLADALPQFGRYPPNEGAQELLAAISGWIGRRYGVAVEDDRLMVLNGTREGLYNVAMALCPEAKAGAAPTILIPNPFYQVYAVAALSVGAEPVFVNATEASGQLPDYGAVPGELLDRTALAYVCSPANPQGAVASREYWRDLLDLAERHDFRIVADECYSEIYRDTPPVGLLEVGAEIGADPERSLVFNSLSKRSNLPGLRSGFVAGGSGSIRRIRQLRAYAGAPLPTPLQSVAAAVWDDEDHVDHSRALYREKYALADEILGTLDGYTAPPAGFFLWLPVEDGEEAARWLWQETGVQVLPGSYLSRETEQGDPGRDRIRIALVADIDSLRRGLSDVRSCLYD